jgi:hypothetical protein
MGVLIVQPAGTLLSKEEQPVAFQLLVIAAMAYVANDKMGHWHDNNML